MANAGRTGNCLRRSVHGRPASVGDSGIRGMNRTLPEHAIHVYICAVMYRWLICRSDAAGSLHRRVIVRQPAYSRSRSWSECWSSWSHLSTRMLRRSCMEHNTLLPQSWPRQRRINDIRSSAKDKQLVVYAESHPPSALCRRTVCLCKWYHAVFDRFRQR